MVMNICKFKKIAVLLLVGICSFVIAMPTYAYEEKYECVYKHQQLTDLIPDSVSEYIDSILADVLDSALNLAIDIGIGNLDIHDFQLCAPYIVYNFHEYQDEIYYYPISANGKIEFILGIIGAENGYTHQIGREYGLLKLLNETDYINNECIFYVIDGDLYYEQKTGGHSDSVTRSIYISAQNLRENELSFLSKSFDEKQQIISDKVNFFRPAQKAEFDCNVHASRILGSMKAIKLRNPQNQYIYNMCWACVVATIANTVNMTSCTGFDVCNRMGINYNKGADIYEMKTALSYYGVDYKIKNGIPYWSEIKKNIDNGYPLAMILFSKYPDLPAHTVTLAGYNDSNKYIRIYDSQNTYNPDNESNEDNPYSEGDYYEFLYTARPRIARNDLVYSWEETLSEY